MLALPSRLVSKQLFELITRGPTSLQAGATGLGLEISNYFAADDMLVIQSVQICNMMIIL